MDKELDVVGRSFGSDTLAEKTSTGDWKVTVTMTERRMLLGSEWEERKLSAQCTDSTFEKAYGIAMNSTLEQFNDALEVTKTDSLFDSVELTQQSK